MSPADMSDFQTVLTGPVAGHYSAIQGKSKWAALPLTASHELQ